MNNEKISITIDADGNKFYKNSAGQLHRLDGPAIEYIDGSTYWYKNAKWHRDDGPAITLSGGTKYWFKEGKKHRVGGPAVEFSDGENQWFHNGKRHRIDGPAVCHDIRSHYLWYRHGKSFKNKQEFFESLSNKQKEIAIFSEDFFKY